MKKIFLLISALAGSIPVFSQLSAGSQGLTIKQGTTMSTDGLVLIPSADLQVNSRTISVTDTPIVLANGSSIKKVFSIIPSLTYSGVVGIKYKSNQLNGNAEDSLKISFFNGGVLNTKPSQADEPGTYYVFSDPVSNQSMSIVTANRPIPGVITKSLASLSAMNSTYGNVSTSQSFNVSGTDIITGITATAPAGFEVSTDSVNYLASVQVTGSGTIASSKIFVRLKSNTDVGAPTGYVVLTSPASVDAPRDSVLIPAGNIAPRSITVASLGITTRLYNGLTNATASSAPTLSSAVNGDVLGVDTVGATLSFTTKTAGANKAVTVSGYALTGAKKNNYTLMPVTGITGTINRLPASVTVANITKCFTQAIAVHEDSTHFSTSGFIGNEGISYVDFASAGLAANVASGNYNVTASNAVGNANTDTANYAITYNAGQITVLDAINATITTAANVQLCAGNAGSVSINTSAGYPFTGRFRILNQTTGVADTVSFQVNNSGQSAPSIPASYLTNTGISPINYKINWVSLQQQGGNGCAAPDNQLTGQVIITVFPVPNINAVASASSLCNGSGVSIALSNPNGVGGSYNVSAQYNGVLGGNIPPVGTSNNAYATGVSETLSLNNSVTAPVDVVYVFTPVTAITSYACVGTNDTVRVTVNPKPRFDFAVNSNTVAVDGTDTICQATATTFALTNATNGHTFTVKHTWVDGNNVSHTNNSYASGTIVDGGFSANFVSGGNSVNPSVNPTGEPTAGTYEITVSNPAFSGCTTTHSFNIYVQPKPEFDFTVNGTTVAIGGTDTICQAAPTTFAIANATNGYNFSVTHSWVDGASTPHTSNYGSGVIANGGFTNSFISGGNSVNPSVDPSNEPTAGTYQITLTNPTTGCVTTRSFNVYVQPKPQFEVAVNGNVMAIGGTDTICQAAPTTFAITNATNGQTFSIKHTWVDGNSVTQTNNNYGAGTVANGGFSTNFISGGNSVAPSVNPTNEPTAGAYEITMTNPTTGCTTVRTFNIYVQPKPEFSVAVNGNVMAIGGTDTICQAAPTTFAIVNATDGQTFSIKHTWVDGNSVTQTNNNYGTGTIDGGTFSTEFISGGNSVNPSVNPSNEPTAGAYEVTMTNPATGCTTTRTFNIYVQPKPQFSVAVNGNVMAIGGTDTICQAAPTTFAITDATNGQTFSIKHTWVDGNSVTQTNNNYGTGTVANGGFSTSFISGGNSVNPSVNPTNEPTAGAYEITMTNPATGCTTTRTFNIYVQPKPEFDVAVNGNVMAIGGTDTICQAAPTTFAIVNATDGQSFSIKHTWVDGNNVTQTNNNYGTGIIDGGTFSNSFTSGGNSVNPAVNPANEPTAGAYEVTMTNPTTGCTTVRTFNIYVNPKPVDLFAVDGTTISNGASLTRCAGVQVQLAFTGTSSHSFDISRVVDITPMTVVSGNVNDAPFTYTSSIGDAGNYTIVLTDTVTGCTATSTYTMNINEPATFSSVSDAIVTGNDNGICGATVNYTAEAVGTGSITYTHTFTGATTSNGAQAGTGSGSLFNKGVTTVTVKASNGLCVDRDTTFTITVNDTENPTVSYTAGNITGVQANHTGCSYHVTTTNPVINDNCGTNGLTLTYQMTGATVASGNGNVGTFDFNVGTTTVTYTVKDEANNEGTASYTVTVGSSAPSIAQVGSSANAACYGSSTGSFTFQYNNPTSGLTNIQIKNVATGNVIYTANNPISIFTGTQSNLAAGTYRLYATNAFGCTDSATVTIGQPSAPLALGTGLTSTNITCGSPNSGTLTFGATGGTLPYQVAITGGNLSTTPNTSFTAGSSFNGYQLTGLAPGTYTVSITDGHSCNIAQSITITAPASAITASVSAPGVPSCISDPAPRVTFRASGGIAPYTFNYTLNGVSKTISTMANSDTVSVVQPDTAAGTFTYALATVVDTNGTPCSLNIASGQGATNVTVIDCSGPDLVPVVFMPATTYTSATGARSVILTVYNVGTGPTHGLVSVTILKPTIGFTYSSSSLPSNWTATDNGATITFETTNTIDANGSVLLNGSLIQTPGANANGVYTMTTFINSGAGGETNTTNNVKFTTISVTP